MPPIPYQNVIDIATKPAWIWACSGQEQNRQHLRPRARRGERQLAGAVDQDQFDPALNWKDVEWIKKYWPGKLVIKGILDVDDSRMAVKLGADAIVVSNHGGRQLDGAPSSISMLPKVADAVGASTEVLFDGGIRTGADIMRALALGARACLIGRSYVYGLGAGGQAGVAKAIDILEKELSVTMALTGTAKVTDIGPQVIVGGEGRRRRASEVGRLAPSRSSPRKQETKAPPQN